MKLTNHIDGGKAAQLVNMLLHLIANDTDANTLLTATGQIGYNQATNRAIIRTASAIRNLLTNADIYAGDMRDDATAPTASAAEAKATAVALKSLETYLLSIINNNSIVTEIFDAEEATQFPTGATPNKRYRVTSPGTVLGVVLGNGDVFFPSITSPSPTNVAHWVFLQGNVDMATTFVDGIVRLMTDFNTLDELTTINNNTPTRAATAQSLSRLRALLIGFLQSRIWSNTINITVGSNTITHNLGSSNLQVQARASDGSPVPLAWSAGTGSLSATVNTIVFNSLVSLSNVNIRIQADNLVLIP